MMCLFKGVCVFFFNITIITVVSTNLYIQTLFAFTFLYSYRIAIKRIINRTLDSLFTSFLLSGVVYPKISWKKASEFGFLPNNSTKLSMISFDPPGFKIISLYLIPFSTFIGSSLKSV